MSFQKLLLSSPEVHCHQLLNVPVAACEVKFLKVDVGDKICLFSPEESNAQGKSLLHHVPRYAVAAGDLAEDELRGSPLGQPALVEEQPHFLDLLLLEGRGFFALLFISPLLLFFST